MGLIVLLNYKATGDAPKPVLPVLAEKNIGLAAIKPYDLPGWVKCGLALDAVHNLRAKYKIDPARTYLYAFDMDYAGEQLAMGCPDVFNGAFVGEFIDFWRPVRASNGGFYPNKLAQPPAKQLALARTHPLLLHTYEISEHSALIEKAFRADGFKFVKLDQMTHEDNHYPNYAVPWFTRTVEYLDEHATKPKAAAGAAAATSRPAR
jgi:hypothetical protein